MFWNSVDDHESFCSYSDQFQFLTKNNNKNYRKCFHLIEEFLCLEYSCFQIKSTLSEKKNIER